MAQPHHQHRHRLRVWRQAHRAQISGKELVSVPALETYYAPAKPFLAEPELAPPLSAQQQHDELLNIDDVLGKRIISTRLHRNITIREENATAALETMSRFGDKSKMADLLAAHHGAF